jgi:proton glutamate symport protein
VCVPSVVEALERLGFGRRDVGLVVPLGITMFRFGNITCFAVATLFVAQLYDVQLEGADLAFIILGSVLAGVATAGTSGVLTLIMLDIVLVPLELPLSGVLPLFIVLEPVMTPLRTIVNVVANCALAALWAERGKAAEVQTSS